MINNPSSYPTNKRVVTLCCTSLYPFSCKDYWVPQEEQRCRGLLLSNTQLFHLVRVPRAGHALLLDCYGD